MSSLCICGFIRNGKVVPCLTAPYKTLIYDFFRTNVNCGAESGATLKSERIGNTKQKCVSEHYTTTPTMETFITCLHSLFAHLYPVAF